MNDFLKLSGKRVVITGAAGYLGTTFSRAFLECGASVLMVDKNTVALSASSDTLVTDFPNCVYAITSDLSKCNSTEKILSAAKEDLGQVDILINNASFTGMSELRGWLTDFGQQSEETFQEALKVNLVSAFSLSKKLLPLLSAGDGGAIINVGSIYGVVGPDMALYENIEGMGNPAAYAASKGGLLQLTRWLATIVAPKVRANMLSPGGIYRQQNPEFVERYVRRVPMARMATEDDMVGTMLYLASDMSRYVTGQNIIVDGGFVSM